MSDQDEETKPANASTPEQSHAETANQEDGVHWGRTIISIIVILAAAGIMVVLYRDRNNTEEVAEATPPPPQVEIQSPEIPSVTPPPPGQTPPPAITPPPAASPNPPTETPPPPPQTPQVAGNSTTNPEWTTKEQPSLGFKYIIRGSWKEKIESNRVTVYDPVSGAILATVEVLNSPNASLDYVYKQFQNSPEVRNIQTIDKNGQAFLHYNIVSTNGFGYATTSGSKIYYITDYSTNGAIAEHFKTI